MNRRRLVILLTLTLLTIAAAVVTGYFAPKAFGTLAGTGFSKPILALEFVRSAEAFTDIVGPSRDAFRNATRADWGFIVAYGLLWTALLFVAGGPKRRLIREIGLLGLFLAVVADGVENWFIVEALRPSPALFTVISTAATVKWLTLGIVWLTLVERLVFTDCGNSKVLRGCAAVVAAGYGLAGAIALVGTTMVVRHGSASVLEAVLWPLFVALPLQGVLLAWATWHATTPAPSPAPSPTPGLAPVAPGHPEFTKDLDDVRKKELEYITRRRMGAPAPAPDCKDVSNTLVGLALSGGGIRSATTNLGILQALSRMGVLPAVDYLRTVSGGGYIGACLTSLLSFRRGAFPDAFWAQRQPNHPPDKPYDYHDRRGLRFTTQWKDFPFNADLRRSDDPCCAPTSPDSIGKKIVAHLRTHGNFLIARRGLLKRDALRAVGHLLTGITYHVLATMVILFVAALVVMGIAHGLEPDLRGALEKPTPVTSTELATITPLSGVGQVYRVGQPRYPSIGTAVWARLKTAGHDASVHLTAGPLLRCMGIGAAATLLVFAAFVVAAGLNPWPRKWKAGESQEDAFDRILLNAAGLVLIAAAGACALITRGGASDDHIASLAAPFIVLTAARVTTFVLYMFITRADVQNRTWPWRYFNLWTRQFRSLWGSFQAMAVYGMALTLVLALIPILSYAANDVSPWEAITPVVSLVFSRLLVTQTAANGASRLRIPASVLRAVLGLAVGVFVVASLVVFGALAARFHFADPWTGFAFFIALVAGAMVLMFLSLLGDINRISPHYFYRDRLLETYLRIETPRADKTMTTFSDASGMQLREMHGVDPVGSSLGNTAPYTLISAAINLPGSRDLTRKDRKSGYFLFSKYYCGSRHTGYRTTETWRDGGTKLSRAMTISGAAVSTAMGSNTFFGEAFVLAVFNVRLGYWMANPRFKGNDSLVFWPRYMLQEVLGSANERTPLVNLSDGGHTGDNVGIYPLLERRCQVIIACDAEADAGLSFGSFTEALRHAYVDLGVTVDIDLSLIRPDPVTGLSKSHCAVGRVKYPECPDRPNWIVYLKNSLTGDEPAPVMNYRTSYPLFPHESTVDQFFDDAQFESYRALGVHIAEDALASWMALDGVGPALATPRA